jgi:hypothetical protein
MAFDEAVLRIVRFCTHRFPRTQPAMELTFPRRLVISERAARTAIMIQRLDSGPPGTATPGALRSPKRPRSTTMCFRRIIGRIHPVLENMFPHRLNGIMSRRRERVASGEYFRGVLPGRVSGETFWVVLCDRSPDV